MFQEINRDEYFMREALKEANKAFSLGEVPIGAVVVANNFIIGRGHNYVEQLHDVTAHAEMIAITSASEYLGNKYLKECTLYVTLEPCLMCASAIMWTQMNRIVYGAADLKRGFSSVRGEVLHPKTKVVSGVLNMECGSILTRFFEAERLKKNLS